MTSYNNIPTLLGTRNLQGYMLLTNDRIASFQFTKMTDQILLLTGDSIGTGGTGTFDRISRHLLANTKDVRYDLICRETGLAG